MKAIVWTSTECETCARIHIELAQLGYDIEERPVSGLVSGGDTHTLRFDAMVQLTMQLMTIPVIWTEDHGFLDHNLQPVERTRP